MKKYFDYSLVLVLWFSLLMIYSGCGGGGGGNDAINSSLSTPQKVFSEFVSAAESQDVDKMVNNFHPSIKSAYADIYNNIKKENKLTEYTNAIKNAKEVYTKKHISKYEFSYNENGQIIKYYIYMIKDQKGDWTIYSL